MIINEPKWGVNAENALSPSDVAAEAINLVESADVEGGSIYEFQKSTGCVKVMFDTYPEGMSAETGVDLETSDLKYVRALLRTERGIEADQTA